MAENKKLRLVIHHCPLMSFLLNPRLSTKIFVPCPKLLRRIIVFFSWNLKSSYHHVDIYPDHQKYLGFSWLFKGTPRYCTFSVLQFGLSTACFCFTNLMRPLVKRWRSVGHVIFVYLDDGFASQPDRLSALAASSIPQKGL